jgi:prolyl oligopeptidase
MALGTSCQQKETLVYPAAERENVTDKYFDTEVADPYRWLENDTAAATAAWVEAENRVTEAYLSKIPYRNKLRERLTELNDYEKIGTPFVKNGKYYFFKNDGLQNQSVLYVADNADDVTAGRALPLLDPNKFSDDGTVALGTISFSNDGKYLAYSVSQSGSDWKEIYVMDLNTKQLTSDKIQWAKSTDISWLKDGFFYSAFDAPSEKGKEYSNVNENHKIYYHKVGTPQADDKLYYANPKFPKRFYSAAVPEEENAVFIYEAGANNGNRLFIDANLFFDSKKMPIQEIASDDQFEYAVVEVVGRFFYVLTNYNAPKYRLMVGDIRMPEIKNWSDVLPETENVLTSVDFTNGKIIAVYDKDATHRAYVYSTEGKLENEIALPTYGSVGFSTNKNEKDIFYAFTSFTFPNTIYKYDISANKSDVYIEPKVKFNPEDYQTEQHFYASKDGTRIPLYLVYKKGLAKNGKNPALLYGYGGFNITYRPSFSTSRIPFLDCGGVYAIANIRGGGEYGEEWHIAGTKMQKQNVFDDFIAAGEYLISEKYTSKEKLACIGGSNGGLLVGAVVNQRPDLWRVAIPEVGVMDMLRYHLFTIGWNWASDYGRSDDSREMFEYLKAYSPLHNIKNDGTPYPAILITTADHDDRVVPAHSFKYAAQLQASDTGSAPKLIRIESKAGHGGGKPLTKQIDELTDIYSFIFYNLGMRF